MLEDYRALARVVTQVVEDLLRAVITEERFPGLAKEINDVIAAFLRGVNEGNFWNLAEPLAQLLLSLLKRVEGFQGAGYLDLLKLIVSLAAGKCPSPEEVDKLLAQFPKFKLFGDERDEEVQKLLLEALKAILTGGGDADTLLMKLIDRYPQLRFVKLLKALYDAAQGGDPEEIAEALLDLLIEILRSVPGDLVKDPGQRMLLLQIADLLEILKEFLKKLAGLVELDAKQLEDPVKVKQALEDAAAAARAAARAVEKLDPKNGKKAAQEIEKHAATPLEAAAGNAAIVGLIAIGFQLARLLLAEEGGPQDLGGLHKRPPQPCPSKTEYSLGNTETVVFQGEQRERATSVSAIIVKGSPKGKVFSKSTPGWWRAFTRFEKNFGYGIDWDKGHLLARDFGGPGRSEARNLAPILSTTNRSAFNSCQMRIVEALEASGCVYYEITVRYVTDADNQLRPASFTIFASTVDAIIIDNAEVMNSNLPQDVPKCSK